MSELCFKLDDNDILMDQVLIDYNDDPVFYVCKDRHEDYYIVLCTDMGSATGTGEAYVPAKYYISKTDIDTLAAMVSGELPMRDAFLQGYRFWSVEAGENIEDDRVTIVTEEEIQTDDLPKEDAMYKAYSPETRAYRERLVRKAFGGMKLQRLFFRTIEFKRIGDKNDNELVYSLEDEILSNNEAQFQVNVRLVGEKSGEYTTHIEITGVFTSEGKGKSVKKQTGKEKTDANDGWIRDMAVSMLMPYVRSELNMLMSQAEINNAALLNA